MRNIVFFICGFIFLVNIKAQEKKELSGVVTDAEKNLVNQAMVCLRNQQDSTYVTSVQTDSLGHYQLHCFPGKYLLQIYHLSYLPFWATVDIDSSFSKDIQLTMSQYALKNIDVVAKRKAIKSKRGNLFVDVSLLSKENEDLSQFLNKLPGVSCLKNQTLKLNGLPAVVYLNGSKIRMGASQLQQFLKSLPSKSMASVELLAIPDASYDSSTQAVIKIHSKSTELNGYYGQLYGLVNVNDFKEEQPANGNFFYSFSKKGVSGYTANEIGRRYGEQELYDSINYGIGQHFLERNSSMKIRSNQLRSSNNLNIELGAARVLRFNFFVFQDWTKEDTPWSMNKENSFIYDKKYTYNKTHDGVYSADMIFENADSLKHHYSFSYSIVTGKSNSMLKSSNEGNRELPYLKQELEMNGTQHFLKAQWNERWNEKLRAYVGLSTSYGSLTDKGDYHSETTRTSSVSRFKGNEWIAGIYSGLTYDLNEHFSGTASLRAEYTNYELNLQSEQIKELNRYWHFLPYLSLTYQVSSYMATLGIQSNLVRPNYYRLLPSTKYETSFLYTKGNPYLKPEKDYLISFNQRFLGAISLKAQYRFQQDLSRVAYRIPSKDRIEKTYLNIGDLHRFDLSLTAEYACLGGAITGSLSGYFSHKDFVNLRSDYELAAGQRKSFNVGYLEGNLQSSLGRFSFNIEATYYPREASLQYTIEPYWYTSMDVGFTFLKDKNLTFKLSGTNLLNSIQREKRYRIGAVNRLMHFSTNARNVYLSLSYRFKGGKDFSKKLGKGSESMGRFQK